MRVMQTRTVRGCPLKSRNSRPEVVSPSLVSVAVHRGVLALATRWLPPVIVQKQLWVAGSKIVEVALNMVQTPVGEVTPSGFALGSEKGAAADAANETPEMSNDRCVADRKREWVLGR